jgi:FKBP-type peptidyl-prolyl cis-trans isomerase
MSQDPLEGPPTLPPGLEAVRTPTGLEYLDVAPGHGAVAREGKKVTVRYHAWLTQGTLVDSTERRGEPAEYELGRGDVIPALEEGILGMQAGGRRRLIVPSDLAYGPQGHGRAIPPYATLIVDVELLAIG